MASNDPSDEHHLAASLRGRPRKEAPQSPHARPAAPSAGASGWRYTFSSLSNQNFLYLWLGMLAMMGGMQMQMLVRGYLVYDLTGSAALLGIVSASSSLPILALALFGGAVADRLERRRVIQVGQAAAAALALLVGIAITTDTITWQHLMAASFIQGAAFSFIMPARQAIIPQLVGRDRLTNAMALNGAGMSAMTLAAPAVAGGIYAWAGPDKAYYVISGLQFLAVLLVGLIPKLDGDPVRSKEGMTSDIAAGIRYIMQSPLVLVLLMMGLITTLLAQPFRFLLPVFVVDLYHRGPDSMGLLVTVMGAGSLAGSLFIASLGRWRRGMILILGTACSGVALLLVAVFPFYRAAIGIMVILGLGDASRRALNQALIMEETDSRFQGRVMSVFMMNFGLMPMSVLPAGIAADLFGAQRAIGTMAMLLLAISAIIVVTQRRLRTMP